MSVRSRTDDYTASCSYCHLRLTLRRTVTDRSPAQFSTFKEEGRKPTRLGDLAWRCGRKDEQRGDALLEQEGKL